MRLHTRLTKTLAVLLCIFTLLAGCTQQANTNSTATSSVVSTQNTSSIQDTASNAVSSSPVDGVTSQESPKEDSENTEAQSQSFVFSFDAIPAYSGTPYTPLNNNLPVFDSSQLSAIGVENYSPLDSLGRCGVAFAVCGKEIMPKADEERGSISNVKPSGWVQASYDIVDGKYLYNRSHLLGWQLSAENANKSNLITGTRYMNTQGMLPFENMIADYIKETGNHVAYRVTPRFNENDLVCKGVELEAYSVEDQGEGICFHVYVYNLQPGVTIDYQTGNSRLTNEETNSEETEKEDNSTPQQNQPQEESDDTSSVVVYITPTGKRYHNSSTCGGKNSKKTDLQAALALGLTPCKKCVK